MLVGHVDDLPFSFTFPPYIFSTIPSIFLNSFTFSLHSQLFFNSTISWTILQIMPTEKKNHSAISIPDNFFLGSAPCAWMRGSSSLLQNKATTTATTVLLPPNLPTGFKLPQTQKHPLPFTRSLLWALYSLATNPTTGNLTTMTTTMTMMMSLPVQKVIINTSRFTFTFIMLPVMDRYLINMEWLQLQL